MPVNPKKTPFRVLRFDTLDDAAAEFRRLHEAGYVQHANWSLGRIARHCAYLMTCSLDGFPPEMKVFPPVRWLMAATLPVWKNLRYPRGMALPGKLAMLRPPESVEDADGVAGVIAAIERLKAEPQRHPSPLIGNPGREGWDLHHRNHCAHHLGYLTPKT